MIIASLVVYALIALGALLVSSMLRDHANDTQQPLTFWQRNNIALAAFWPFTLLLLALDAALDYRHYREGQRVLHMHVIERELREAQDALDVQIQRPIGPSRVVQGGKR